MIPGSLRSVLAACALVLLPACAHVAASADVGYGLLALDGRFGYAAGSTSGSQDVRSAFGLGDDQGVPYARGQLELGGSQFSLSGFAFEDSGTGTLEANFGSSPVLIAGTQVRSEFELWTLKGAYAFEIPILPGISVAPGLAVDYVDLHVRVQDVIGIATDEVDLSAPIPLLFVRAKGVFGPVCAVAEVGYMKADVDEVELSLLDVDAMLRVNPLPLVHFFLGYRWFAIDGSGSVDGDAFDTDLTLGGFLVGGGVDF